MRAEHVDVSDADRVVLESWIWASTPAGMVDRARIVLWAADGMSMTGIADRLGGSRPTARAWCQRYRAEGLTG